MSRRMGPLSTACTVSYCRARDEPSTRIWKEAQQRQVFGLSNGRIDSTIGERNPWLPGGIFKMEVTAYLSLKLGCRNANEPRERERERPVASHAGITLGRKTRFKCRVDS